MSNLNEIVVSALLPDTRENILDLTSVEPELIRPDYSHLVIPSTPDYREEGRININSFHTTELENFKGGVD